MYSSVEDRDIKTFNVSLFKLDTKFAKPWTLFSSNVNTTIRKHSSRASIFRSGLRYFLGLFKFAFGSEGDFKGTRTITSGNSNVSSWSCFNKLVVSFWNLIAYSVSKRLKRLTDSSWIVGHFLKTAWTWSSWSSRTFSKTDGDGNVVFICVRALFKISTAQVSASSETE